MMRVQWIFPSLTCQKDAEITWSGRLYIPLCHLKSMVLSWIMNTFQERKEKACEGLDFDKCRGFLPYSKQYTWLRQVVSIETIGFEFCSWSNGPGLAKSTAKDSQLDWVNVLNTSQFKQLNDTKARQTGSRSICRQIMSRTTSKRFSTCVVVDFFQKWFEIKPSATSILCFDARFIFLHFENWQFGSLSPLEREEWSP